MEDKAILSDVTVWHLCAPSYLQKAKVHTLAAGVRGGAEAVLHTLQALAENPADPHVILKLDMTNAYNTIHRDHVLKAVFNEPALKPLWRMVLWAYGSPSDLLSADNTGNIVNTLSSAQGMRQGDPLAPLLFAVGVKQLYQSTADILREDNGSGVLLAFLDDVNLAVRPNTDVTTRALAHLSQEAARIGLTFNGKGEAAYFRADRRPLHPDFVDRISNQGLKFTTEAIVILGGIVGAEEKHLRAAAESAAAKHQIFFKRLTDSRLPTQLALLLLRASGLNRANYVSRCSDPAAGDAYARCVDRLVYTVLGHRLHLSEEEMRTAAYHLKLPTRLGGAGFRLASEMAPIAWWSSLVQTAPFIRG